MSKIPDEPEKPGELLTWNELLGFCESDLLSEEGLHEIFERYGLTPDKGYISNNYEFFRAACHNERVTEGIIRSLIEYFPDAASATDERGWSPLHYSCRNPNVTLGIIQLLIDASSDSVRCVDNGGMDGWMALHFLCWNHQLDEITSIEILKLLIEKHPEAVRHADIKDNLPIHIAAEARSPEFCQLLIEAYPESEQRTNGNDALPLHHACWANTIAAVEYLHQQYPNAINHAAAKGHYPIHYAISSVKQRDDPAAAVGIVRFLLDCDPTQKLKQHIGMSLLHYACGRDYYSDSNIGAGIQIIEMIFDAHPDSIRSEDNHGWMPIHHLCSAGKMDETAAVQILKLLIEKHPEAVRHASIKDNLPIHIAAEAGSPEFCQLLIEAYPESEQRTNGNDALPLHLASRANTIAAVEYVYQQYPDAINHATTEGHYPIHYAISSVKQRDDPAAAVEIVRFLLDCDPTQKLKQYEGMSLLQYACGRDYYSDSNIGAGIQIIEMIFDAHPDSICSENNRGSMPIHHLCRAGGLDKTAVQILKLLINKHPEAVRHADSDGDLPIHLAAYTRSPEFCRLLIEAYPESEQRTNGNGELPLHLACWTNTIDTVQYLYQHYPDAINHATAEGHYPIHYAISSVKQRDDLATAVGIVRFLLGCDPTQKLKQYEGMSLLQYACEREYYNDSNIDAGIQIIKMIFDAHPGAIEDNRIASSIHNFHQRVQAFINKELVYARQAKDRRLMTTPDDNGQLPLHRALQNNVGLGSIKLLVKGNPHAIQSPDSSGTIPLHIACQHHDSASVVQYLVELDTIVGLDATSLGVVDQEGNTALHYACRGAKYDTVAMLLEMYHAASVSTRNARKKLPIELLWESNAVEDKESVEYFDSVFQLLKAYPETLRNVGTDDQPASTACSGRS